MCDKTQPQGSPNQVPQEWPAVKTTIVGGRPPGSGKAVRTVPRGIEVLIKKAAVDPEFRRLLLELRSKAAGLIGLVLEPAEAAMLDMATAEQLEATIARTNVEKSAVPALLGKAAAVMLAALGAGYGYVAAQNLAQNGARAYPMPVTAPTTQPADDANGPVASTTTVTQPSSQPATQPAVTREQILPILKQLDSNDYQKREAAQKQLQDLGVAALPVLRETLKPDQLSPEVVHRIKAAMWNIKTTTRPALVEPTSPPHPPMAVLGARAIVPPENPED